MNHPFQLTRVAQICTGFALVSFVQVASANDAEIVMVQGKVEVQDQKSGLWRNAVAKQELRAGDSVRTGDSSQMALLVRDKTQVRLNQLSTFKIKEAGDGEGGTSLELTSGRMWAQAKQFTVGLLRATTGLIKSQRKLSVSTPTATIGIRGTDWEVSVGDSGETVVSVFSG
ncbi:MAG: FecR domain-containing protein, partial [Candidatus Saccharibacteria bacterium]|nr:FecR domain-containing protein [Rhodoferax sp.]